MRKRTINDLYDKLIWGVITLFPLIAYVVYLFSLQYSGAVMISTTEFWTTYLQIGFVPDLAQRISEVVNSVAVIFDDTSVAILEYGVWFIFVTLAHVVLDVILCIPKWCANAIDKAVQ